MTISHLSEWETSSRAPAFTPEYRNGLKQAIKHFLLAASGRPSPHELCPHCGQQMEYVKAILQWYGEDEAFRIRVPVCGCKETVPK